MPLGLIAGRPFSPFKRAISSRCSSPCCFSAASSPNSSTSRASSSGRLRSDRARAAGTHSVESHRPNRSKRKSHRCPQFCPSYTERCPVMKRPVMILLACLLTGGAYRPVVAQVPPTAPAATAPAEQVDAMAILTRMTDTLAKATSFSVTLNVTYDVVQEAGEKVEFGEVRRILLSRPNGLRIDLDGRDGTRQQTTFG